jgi:integrase
MRLTHSEPRSGSLWTNTGKPRDRQPLKHRADGDTRSVPIHPKLVQLLRHHIDTYGAGPDGRLLVGPRGGIMADRTYLAAWHKARRKVLTAQEAASPLAETPYALRHAAVSTWLAAGVPPQQVAAWAGHSVNVLLRFYAACVAGLEEEALRRILGATTVQEEEATIQEEEDEDIPTRHPSHLGPVSKSGWSVARRRVVIVK